MQVEAFNSLNYMSPQPTLQKILLVNIYESKGGVSDGEYE